MGTLPAKVCVRCKRAYKGRCENCGRKREQRGTARERGYTRTWERERLVYLAENPLCVGCEGQGEVTAATVVDHVVPHRGDRELFWDTDNWQPLCKPHHDWKTWRELEAETMGVERWVVCGPPGAGKTTWAQARRRPGWILFDLDELAKTLMLLPTYPRPDGAITYLMALRQATVATLRLDPTLSAIVIVADVDEARRVAREINGRVVDVRAAKS